MAHGVNDGHGVADATFDNYSSSPGPVVEPVAPAIDSVDVASGEVAVAFSTEAGQSYLLQTSPDLQNWTDQPGATFSEEAGTGTLTLATGGQPLLFVRVVATVE